MSTVKQIDLKIQELQKKKKQLEDKQAKSFFESSQSIIGDEFSPELALAIIESSWSKASENNKEAWQKSAEKFLNKKPNRRAKTTPKA